MSYSRTRWTLSLTPLLMSPLLLSGCGGMQEQAALTPDSPSTLEGEPLPQGMQWVQCPNEGSDEQMRTVGSRGGAITLPTGQRLLVGPRAVPSPTEFILQEPRSEYIVVRARAVGVGEFGGDVRLRVSWRDRPGCTVPADAVLMRIVPGKTALPLQADTTGVDFIEVRVDSLSTFAIAT